MNTHELEFIATSLETAAEVVRLREVNAELLEALRSMLAIHQTAVEICQTAIAKGEKK